MSIDSQDFLAITAKEVSHPELVPAQGYPPQLTVECMIDFFPVLLWQWDKELRVVQHDVDVEPVVGTHVLRAYEVLKVGPLLTHPLQHLHSLQMQAANVLMHASHVGCIR